LFFLGRTLINCNTKTIQKIKKNFIETQVGGKEKHMCVCVCVCVYIYWEKEEKKKISNNSI